MHRFFAPSLGTENHLWLDGPEADHLSRVLRVQPGEEVGVFDGSGVECLAAVERVERHRVKLQVLSREAVSRDPALAVTLACAVVKAKAMDLLVEKCAELGVRQIIPVESRRSVPKVAEREAAHLIRWQRTAAEASKQCRRTTLTAIAAPRPLDALLEKAGDWELRLAFSPYEDAEPLRTVLAACPAPASVVYLIGPEGGFERAETRNIVSAGFDLVRLGKSTLTTETAAVAALAAILYHYEG
jgi:16S rRNA (uracil1498-N3)-methyltransferase